MASSYYTRVCTVCGDEKQVTYKPKGTEKCSKCNKKELGAQIAKRRYKKHVYVRYWYFCPTCANVRAVKRHSKTPYCANCSRKYSKSKHKQSKFEFSFVTMTTLCVYEWKKPKVIRVYKPKPKPKPKKKHKPKPITVIAPKVKVEENLIPKTSREKELKMMEEWLKKNKVKVIP